MASKLEKCLKRWRSIAIALDDNTFDDQIGSEVAIRR
jgi:hypothetical protein